MTTVEAKKAGYLTYFKKGFLYKKWKIGYFVLYKNSQLYWYNNKDDPQPEGSIVIGNIAKHILFGNSTKSVLKRPQAENPDYLIAIPKNIEARIDQILWVYCEDSDLFNVWKSAIIDVLSHEPAVVSRSKPLKPRPPKPRPPMKSTSQPVKRTTLTNPNSTEKVYLSKSLPSSLDCKTEAIKDFKQRKTISTTNVTT